MGRVDRRVAAFQSAGEAGPASTGWAAATVRSLAGLSPGRAPGEVAVRASWALAQEMVLLTSDGGVHLLSESAAGAWRLASAGSSDEEVEAGVARMFGAPPSEIRSDCEHALARLREAGCLPTGQP